MRFPQPHTLCVFIGIMAASIVSGDTLTNYSIAFSGSTPLPTSGQFTYDSTAPAFSNFTIQWNGLTFDLTNAANGTANRGCLIVCAQTTFDHLVAQSVQDTWAAGISAGLASFSVVGYTPQGGLVYNATVTVPPATPALAGTGGNFIITAAPEPGTSTMTFAGGFALLACVNWYRWNQRCGNLRFSTGHKLPINARAM